MSDDVKEKVIQNIKSSPTGMFGIQVGESTDVCSCAQLLVFVRYVFLCYIKEEYMLCTQLETTTTAEDVMEKLSSSRLTGSPGKIVVASAQAELQRCWDQNLGFRSVSRKYLRMPRGFTV